MSEQQRFNIMSKQILVYADMCEYFLTLIRHVHDMHDHTDGTH